MKALAPLNISMLAPPDDTDYRKAVNEMLVHYGEFVSKPLKRKKLPSRADFMAMMELQSSMMIAVMVIHDRLSTKVEQYKQDTKKRK